MGVIMTDEERGVNLGSHSFETDILSLIEQAKPPKLPSSEMDTLDIHTVGILAIKEALKAKPVPHKEYRELSRYATRVAISRMETYPAIVSLCNCRDEYVKQQKKLPQSLRKMWSDALRACSMYRPFVSSGNIHMWYWDDADKQTDMRIRENAGLSLSVLYVFTAGALAELPNLDEIGEDLKREYERGTRYFDFVANSLSYVRGEVDAYLA